MNRLFLTIILLILTTACADAIDANFEPQGWPQMKGTHFVILYPLASDEDSAREVLQKAEDDYTVIADDIGYSRIHNFWTWNERVKIILFDDQQSYVQQTGQPAWSKGFAIPHTGFFKARIIVSYKGQSDFFTDLLPHEMTHLILHDFMGFERPMPLFFDEGVAQSEQVMDDSINYKSIMARLITQGKTIPFASLTSYNLMQQPDSTNVAIFYAESLYIIDFLVKTYGKDAFRTLCRNLRDGDSFSEALKASYYPTIDSIPALEIQWVKYMMQYL